MVQSCTQNSLKKSLVLQYVFSYLQIDTPALRESSHDMTHHRFGQDPALATLLVLRNVHQSFSFLLETLPGDFPHRQFSLPSQFVHSMSPRTRGSEGTLRENDRALIQTTIVQVGSLTIVFYSVSLLQSPLSLNYIKQKRLKDHLRF